MKGAIESVTKLVYAKSVIHGVDDVKPIMHDNPLNPIDISFRSGHPNIQNVGIPVAAGLSLNDWETIKTIVNAVVIQTNGSDLFDSNCHEQFRPWSLVS